MLRPTRSAKIPGFKAPQCFTLGLQHNWQRRDAMLSSEHHKIPLTVSNPSLKHCNTPTYTVMTL
ncbi:hypothetical protein KFK09_024553 [Dendrobium nobile]|uniref:Uncharacterized protein n=1 Tax=Dendrobium nobile TaxID=94219 RepID=A0A8T3AE57_DENNO|nr:hypothetical protein KFK09_024553 [Dendrobium nobile]